MRVGLFIDTYFPMVDGVINVVHNYASRMNDEEFEVVVFCPKADKKYKDEFCYRVERCKSVKVFFLDYVLPLPRLDSRFKKALKNSELDVVHIHSPFGIGKMGVKYAKKHHIPAIATMHSQFEQDLYRATHSKCITKTMLKSVMKVFNSCDEFFAVNERVAEIFYGYGAKRMPLVLRNSTDFTLVADEERAVALANEQFALEKDMPVFLFVGRLTALKNIYFLVDALAQLKNQNYKMFFVGSGKDGEELKHRIAKHGLTDRVIMIGRITDRELLKALYFRANLFLFPSLYDANSLVQIEAASQKTPAVFVEGAATASMVTDGVNGYIAKPTPEAYAQKIEEILSDKEEYESVRAGAYRDLYSTWDDAVRNLKEVYKSVTKKYRENNKS